MNDAALTERTGSQVWTMAFALAMEQKQFIQRIIRSGRYNSQSEVVRAALRHFEAEESVYLAPPMLSRGQVRRIYSSAAQDDGRERQFGSAAFTAMRRAARKGKRP